MTTQDPYLCIEEFIGCFNEIVYRNETF